MAENTATAAAPTGEVAHHDHDGAHVTEGQYWKTFVILAVLTAIEIAWSYLGFSGFALVAPLLIMMTIKFLLVAGVFMHLAFDTKILHGRIFWWVFACSIALAMAVYFVVYATFDWQI